MHMNIPIASHEWFVELQLWLKVFDTSLDSLSVLFYIETQYRSVHKSPNLICD